jgi:hypothetical protein
MSTIITIELSTITLCQLTFKKAWSYVIVYYKTNHIVTSIMAYTYMTHLTHMIHRIVIAHSHMICLCLPLPHDQILK